MRGAFRFPSTRPALFLLAVFALLIGWADDRLAKAMTWRFPAVNELTVTEHYLTDVGCLLIGARRLAADVAYVQFLQYYGGSEHAEEEDEEHAGHDHGPDGVHHDGPPPAMGMEDYFKRQREHDMSRGVYPRLLELSTRVLRLDPYFNGVILEAAGALAFNQKRIDESLGLLREAIVRDPSFFRYHLYVSAILYKQKGNDPGMIALLMEAIKYPDCPPMLEMILGNLLKQVGRPLDAARVFLHTFQTAHKAHDKADALGRLKLVFSQHPDVARQIGAELPAN